MKKLILIIDGNYLFHLWSYAFKRGLKLNFNAFVCYLERTLNATCFVRRMYMGFDSAKISSARGMYIGDLFNANFGWFGRRLTKTGKEKAVDTQSAIDITRIATKNSIVCFVGGDGDISSALLDCKQQNKNITTCVVYGEIEDETGFSEELLALADYKIDFFTLLQSSPEIFDHVASASPSVPPAQAPTTANQGSGGGYVLRKKTQPNLQQEVVNAVKTVISNKEQRWNTSLRFALTSEVGDWLKKSGVTLPYGKTLTDYFKANPTVFHVGYHPRTGAATVSV